MELLLSRPDKSCWKYSAVENGTVHGYVYFFPKGSKANLFIGYIESKQAGVGTMLMESVINFGETNGYESISGQLMPVPGCEMAIINLLSKFDFSIDKKGRVHKQLNNS